MLFPRVLVAACVLNLAVARLLLPYLAAPFAIGAVALAFWWRRRTEPAHQPDRRPTRCNLVPRCRWPRSFSSCCLR